MRARRREGLNITAVHDLACGHGLVGLLLALRFPHIHLASYDLVRRGAYDAFLGAMAEACGGRFHTREGLTFAEGDFNHNPDLNFNRHAGVGDTGGGPLEATARSLALGPESLVLCIHGW